LVDCSLELASRALQLDLVGLEENVERVGVSQSLGGIEVHLTRWIQAFGEYLEIRESHTDGESSIQNNLYHIDGTQLSEDLRQNIISIVADNEEKVMLSVEAVLNVIHEETDGGILIPRIRHHLNYSITSLAVNFSDHADLAISSLICNDPEVCATKMSEGNKDLMPYLNEMILTIKE
jgi:hypothetical protein